MEKRKLRINVMDVLILLLIAAAVAVVLYIFVWSGRKGGAETDTVTLRYVVEIMDMLLPQILIRKLISVK